LTTRAKNRILKPYLESANWRGGNYFVYGYILCVVQRF